MEKLYGEFSEFRKETRERFEAMDRRFDGYKQHSGRLDRIEAEVAKHEELIIGKVKWSWSSNRVIPSAARDILFERKINGEDRYNRRRDNGPCGGV